MFATDPPDAVPYRSHVKEGYHNRQYHGRLRPSIVCRRRRRQRHSILSTTSSMADMRPSNGRTAYCPLQRAPSPDEAYVLQEAGGMSVSGSTCRGHAPLDCASSRGPRRHAAKIRRMKSMVGMVSTYMRVHDEYIWCHSMNFA